MSSGLRGGLPLFSFHPLRRNNCLVIQSGFSREMKLGNELSSDRSTLVLVARTGLAVRVGSLCNMGKGGYPSDVKSREREKRVNGRRKEVESTSKLKNQRE